MTENTTNYLGSHTPPLGGSVGPTGRGGLGIVNYGAGNIFSLTAALERQGISYSMINSPDEFDGFERYIIPGVGHAGAAMKKLEESGMVEKIKTTKKPVLGICVGMQLMTDHSEEGNAKLLGIAPLQTRQPKTKSSSHGLEQG